MKTKSLMIAIALMALVMGMTAAADAATIKLILSVTADGTMPLNSIAPGQRFFAIAQVNDATGIAGAAFTLTYDPTKFEVIKHITSPIYAPGTVVADGEANRIDAILDSDLYGTYTDDRSGAAVTQDIIRLAKVDSAAGKVMFSGAGINKANGTGPATGQKNLFRIRFRAKTGATGTGIFSFGQTTLNNTAAGYSAAGETIPALMGAAVKTNTTAWANLTTTTDCNTSAFCTIPATFDNTAGTVPIQGVAGNVRGLAQAPSMTDVMQLLYYYKHLRNTPGYESYTDDKYFGNLDFNHDGLVNMSDVMQLLYYYKHLRNTPGYESYTSAE